MSAKKTITITHELKPIDVTTLGDPHERSTVGVLLTVTYEPGQEYEALEAIDRARDEVQAHISERPTEDA